MGEVDDDDLGPDPEEVEAARRALGRWCEVDQAVADLLEGHPETARATRRREGVRDVVAGQSADRDGHVGDVHDRRLGAALGFHQDTVTEQVRPATGGEVAGDRA